jgi:hypothetical protein
MRTSARHSAAPSPRKPRETTSTPVMLRTVRRASSSAWRTASSELVVERPMISIVLAAATLSLRRPLREVAAA